MKRTATLGEGTFFALTLKKCRFVPKGYGFGICAIAILFGLALVLMAHQDGLQPTPEQEAAFLQEQARRLDALGLAPVLMKKDSVKFSVTQGVDHEN